MDKTEKTVEKRTIYKGRIINVRTDTAELPNGRMAFRECVEHSGGAAVAAVKDGNIYLVRQFRYPYAESIYEIPAGKINLGEEPIVCAARELTEETGLIAAKLSLLNTVYPTPGYSNEKIYIYLAEGLTEGKINPDEDEFIEAEALPLLKALDMARSGEIKDAKTLIAIYFLTLRR